MIYLLGHQIPVTSERQCRRSSTDHRTLVHEARVDRQRRNFNVEESYVLCIRCGMAIALKLEGSSSNGKADAFGASDVGSIPALPSIAQGAVAE